MSQESTEGQHIDSEMLLTALPTDVFPLYTPALSSTTKEDFIPDESCPYHLVELLPNTDADHPLFHHSNGETVQTYYRTKANSAIRHYIYENVLWAHLKPIFHETDFDIDEIKGVGMPQYFTQGDNSSYPEISGIILPIHLMDGLHGVVYEKSHELPNPSPRITRNTNGDWPIAIGPSTLVLSSVDNESKQSVFLRVGTYDYSTVSEAKVTGALIGKPRTPIAIDTEANNEKIHLESLSELFVRFRDYIVEFSLRASGSSEYLIDYLAEEPICVYSIAKPDCINIRREENLQAELRNAANLRPILHRIASGVHICMIISNYPDGPSVSPPVFQSPTWSISTEKITPKELIFKVAIDSSNFGSKDEEEVYRATFGSFQKQKTQTVGRYRIDSDARDAIYKQVPEAVPYLTGEVPTFIDRSLGEAKIRHIHTETEPPMQTEYDECEYRLEAVKPIGNSKLGSYES